MSKEALGNLTLTGNNKGKRRKTVKITYFENFEQIDGGKSVPEVKKGNKRASITENNK